MSKTCKAPTLKELATRIRTEHKAAEQSVRTALVHARAAGEALNQAKELLLSQGGEVRWLAWVDDNCGLEPRTAQGYMRIAANWKRIGEVFNAKRISYIGVREALDSIADPKDEPDPEAEAAQLEALADEVEEELTPEEKEQLKTEQEEDREHQRRQERERQDQTDGRRDLYDRMAALQAKLRKLSRQDVGGEAYEALLDQLDAELERRKGAG